MQDLHVCPHRHHRRLRRVPVGAPGCRRKPPRLGRRGLTVHLMCLRVSIAHSAKSSTNGELKCFGSILACGDMFLTVIAEVLLDRCGGPVCMVVFLLLLPPRYPHVTASASSVWACMDLRTLESSVRSLCFVSSVAAHLYNGLVLICLRSSYFLKWQ